MVSRETQIREGLERIGLPTERVATLARFAQLLGEVAIPSGFLGPVEEERLVSRHLLESAALRLFTPGEGTLIDVGSGAGLPGLVLSCLREGETVAVESMKRRARFLETVVRELGLRVRVICARAEDVARHLDLRERCACAVARALAPPPVALELTLPFVECGGLAAVVVGPEVDVGAASAAARLLGGSDPRIATAEVPGALEPLRVMIVEKVAPTPDRYPRRAGVPARRPLGQGN